MQDFDVQFFDNAFSFLNLTVPLSWENSLTLLSFLSVDRILQRLYYLTKSNSAIKNILFENVFTKKKQSCSVLHYHG